MSTHTGAQAAVKLPPRGPSSPKAHLLIPALFTHLPPLDPWAPLVHTLAGAFGKAVIAVFAENVPVLFEEILCFIEDILDLLQQLKRCFIESSDTSLEGEQSPLGEDKYGPHVSSLFVKLLWAVSVFSFIFSLPSPVVCSRISPEVGRYVIYS